MAQPGTSTSPSSQFASTNLIEWDEDTVNEWLASIGFSQYHQQIIDNGISGEILSLLDHEGLKEVGVHSVGQRLTILKEVYYLKVAHGITIEPEHYVPPSEAIETSGQEGVSLDRLHEIILELGERTRVLEQDNRRLADSLNYVMDNLATVKTEESDATLRHKVSFGNVLNGSSNGHHHSNGPQTPGATSRMNHHLRLTDASMVESPQTSPQRPEHDMSSVSIASQLPKHSQSQSNRPPPTPTPNSNSNSSNHPSSSDPMRTPLDRSHSQSHSHFQSQQQASSSSRPSAPAREASTSTPTTAGGSGGGAENQFKSFKVSLEDPCWKVLPAALKKYKINDDWRKYVMFICHGSTERCLSYDEKPLLLFQKLKDANKNPVFMLRHIKDIRSPISVAQQKQSQRQRDLAAAGASTPGTPGGRSGPSAANPGAGSGSSGSGSAGGKAEYSRNTRLHQPPMLHPISSQAAAATRSAAEAGGGPQGVGNTTADSGHAADEPSPHPNINDTLATSPPGGGASYAIAIYPYVAEQEDEFDVAVDDTFIIRSREKGWWVVQRDVAGTGVPSTNPEDAPKWIPAGCLLETTLPPNQAIAETWAAVPPSSSPTVTSPTAAGASNKRPILPAHIISTSFPGITLMGYGDKGEHELNLVRGDVLRVFKRYNHWSYAIKEETGERGWVPSWFIGKYTPGSSTGMPALVPPTPTATGTSSTNPTSTNAGGSGSHAAGAPQTPGETSGELLPFPANGNGVNGVGGVNGSPMSQAFPAASQPPGGYMRSAVTLI